MCVCVLRGVGERKKHNKIPFHPNHAHAPSRQHLDSLTCRTTAAIKMVPITTHRIMPRFRRGLSWGLVKDGAAGWGGGIVVRSCVRAKIVVLVCGCVCLGNSAAHILGVAVPFSFLHGCLHGQETTSRSRFRIPFVLLLVCTVRILVQRTNKGQAQKDSQQ